MNYTSPETPHKVRVFNSRMIFVALAVLGLLATTLFLNRNTSATPTNQFFGAIYTSRGDGTVVNQNLYDAKSDVYLNGGPQNQNGNGLPNGTYYFQVTDPSGATLLSTDPAQCRQLVVAGGVVAGAASAIVTGGCSHANGSFNAANNSTPVQLIPFDDTPNNGGEYKVWLIRQTSTTSIAPDTIHLNFKSSDSKTDNFKVKRETPCTDCIPETSISGRKFYDANANGIADPNEIGVGGVNIDITITTDAGSSVVVVTTQPDGSWTFGNLPFGASYVVNEELPFTCQPPDPLGSYWLQTAPAPDTNGNRFYSGTAGANPITGLDFGNICFHPASGGLTLGFWSNKNGEAIIKNGDNYQGDFIFLNGLNLKNPNGSDFDISLGGNAANNYKNQFRAWLLSGNAVNMAYMLSVQLSATSLDVRHGFLNDSQLVDATSLGLGIISIGSVRNAANTELNAPGGATTFTGNPLRDDEEILKNFLDAVNNNKLPFASSTPCSACYPTAPVVAPQ